MPWWLWLIAGLILASLELATPGGFYLIFFGISAVLIGVLTALGFGGPIWVEWTAFALFSVVLVLAFRRPMIRLAAPAEEDVDAIVGRIAVVIGEAIAPGAIGRTDLRGSIRSARNRHVAPLAVGQRCRVVRVEGQLLHVEPER